MKKYLVAIAAIGVLVACSGKKAESEQAVVTEDAAVVETPAESVNVREMLIIIPEKGEVVEEKYTGTIPAEKEGYGASWILTLYYQQGGDGGVFGLTKTYLHREEKNDNTEVVYGKREVIKGAPFDSKAIVYKLIPTTGGDPIYFWANEKGLTRLDNKMNKHDEALNYTLTAIL